MHASGGLRGLSAAAASHQARRSLRPNPTRARFRRRRAKEGSAPLAPADKLAAWEELKVAAFARAAGGAWLLPALDAFVRVQLNILGRHLYLESAVENRWGLRAGRGGGAGRKGSRVLRRGLLASALRGSGVRRHRAAGSGA